MRRGDPLTPQVRQAVCKWIASACRRRNDDSCCPCRPVPRLLRAKALASSRIFYILLKNNQRIETANEVKQSRASIGTRAPLRHHEEQRRCDAVIH